MAPPLPPPLLAPGDEPGQQPPRVQHSTGRPTCARQSDFSSQLESRNRWGGLLLAVEAFAREHERQGRRELRAAAIPLGSIQCFDCSLLAGSKLKARSERDRRVSRDLNLPRRGGSSSLLSPSAAAPLLLASVQLAPLRPPERTDADCASCGGHWLRSQPTRPPADKWAGEQLAARLTWS